MLSIIILLHIESMYGNYASAGLVLAAQSIGQAAAGPMTSRLMGNFGMRRVLIATTAICSALLFVIAFAQLPLWVVAMLAAALGATTPPITSAVRSIFPKIVPGDQISALFSLDASAQEIIWVIGPVAAVFVSTQVGTAWGLALAAAFMVGGGIWFILSPAVGTVGIPRARRRFGAVLTRPSVLISTIVGFLFVAAFASLETGIVAVFGHDGIEAGLILAVLSVGSIIGGLLFGHRAVLPWSMVICTVVVLLGTALSLISLNPFWLGMVLFFGGIGIAPMFAAIYTVVSSTVKFSETAEAFGWINTGQLVGVALGSALAGIAIDAIGGFGGILAATLLLVLTGLAAAIGIRWLPDLRGRDASPLPDTEPMPIIGRP